MNRYDNENNIISDFQFIQDDFVLLFNSTKTAKKIYHSIHSKEQWKKWVNSSGKSDPPPDFYSVKNKWMMDVMRIDDHAYIDKDGKVKNPTNARESKLYKELKDSGIIERFPDADIYINAITDLPTELDHNYTYYQSNFERVVSGHIKKIPLYQSNHPGYKTIFFVIDESSAYGQAVSEKPDMNRVQRGDATEVKIHYFFLDKKFVNVFAGTSIDYLIWFAPFKLLNSMEGIVKLPKAVIYDCKKIRTRDLVEYNCDKMVSTEL